MPGYSVPPAYADTGELAQVLPAVDTRAMLDTEWPELEYAGVHLHDDPDKAAALAELLCDHAEQHLGAAHTPQRHSALARVLRELASSDYSSPAGERCTVARRLQLTMLGRHRLELTALGVTALQYNASRNRCMLESSYSISIGKRGGLQAMRDGYTGPRVAGWKALHSMRWKQ